MDLFDGFPEFKALCLGRNGYDPAVCTEHARAARDEGRLPRFTLDVPRPHRLGIRNCSKAEPAGR